MAALALLLASAALSLVSAEPEPHLVAYPEVGQFLGQPVAPTRLHTEFGGFNALLPPAASAIEPETSAIILWDDCCNSGRSARGRAHSEGTIRATSSF